MTKIKKTSQRRKPPALSNEPIRKLTDRECSLVLGAMIGGLANSLADLEAVRRAVDWWSTTDEAWEGLSLVVRQQGIDKEEIIRRCQEIIDSGDGRTNRDVFSIGHAHRKALLEIGGLGGPDIAAIERLYEHRGSAEDLELCAKLYESAGDGANARSLRYLKTTKGEGRG